MGLAVLTARLLGLASLFHRLTIITFGYFIPALSSVKAVVHKDSEAFFQWSTYWLILHLYSTVLSPILHFTLHPIFQILAIMWLSLPRFQGASVVYDRLVVPWVMKYENQVDEAIHGAHKGAQNWILSNMGKLMGFVIGEGGNLLELVLELVFGKPSVDEKKYPPSQSEQQPALKRVDQSQSSTSSSMNSTERPQPKHSVREALRQRGSSLEDFVVIDGNGNIEHSVELMSKYVNDFKTMMQQGLYVFANVDTNNTTTDDQPGSDGNFCLGVFSFDVTNNGGAFMISPVGDVNSDVVTLPLHGLSTPVCSGSQGIILEWVQSTNDTSELIRGKAEVVLSNEDDRNTLFNCLTKCLPWMRT